MPGGQAGADDPAHADPPVVAFLPDKGSSSWRALRESGERFCVNVLSAVQEDVCSAVAMRKKDKFHDIGWHPSPAGNPGHRRRGRLDRLRHRAAPRRRGPPHRRRPRPEPARERGRTPVLFHQGTYGTSTPH